MKARMNSMSGGILATLSALVGFAGVGLATPRAAAQDRLIRIDGSSTVYPITEAAAEDFQQEHKGTKVTVGISGTGGGFKKFVRGEIDVANASRPIKKEEADEAKKNGIEFVELPVAFDALTVVVHPQNTWATSMTIDELKKMWEPAAQGTILTWNQIRPDWPNEKLVLFGAGTDSGTFDYFTEAVVGKAKSSRGDYTASEDDNVLVKGVEGSKYAIGYFGFSYYAAHEKKLKAVAVSWDKNKATKEPVAPSRDSVLNGTYAPLSRPLFIYVSKKSLETRPEVREFASFYLKHAGEYAGEVMYVPLPEAAYELVKSRLDKGQTGSAFADHSVGLRIEDVLKQEAK